MRSLLSAAGWVDPWDRARDLGHFERVVLRSYPATLWAWCKGAL